MQDNTVKVLIVDDHRMFVDGLTDIFSKEETIKVCGICYSGETVHHQLKEQEIDLVLLDLQIKNISGIDICEYVAKQHPNIKILVLSMFGEESFITKVMQKGAHGYILKSSGRDELLKAIRLVMQGHTYYSSEVTQIIMNSLKSNPTQAGKTVLHIPKISRREKEILKLILEEYTTAEIAKALFISEKTVESHRSNLLTKLNVRNVAGLVKKTIELGVLEHK